MQDWKACPRDPVLSPFRGLHSSRRDPGLAPWAAILRRFAAYSPQLTSGGGKLAGAQALEASVGAGFHHPAELVVVLVTESHEAEGLEDAAPAFAHRVQHFRHAPHVAGLGLKGDLNEVTLRELPGQLQQASGDRNHLDIALGFLAVAELYQRRGSCQLNSRSTMGGVSLGIVCHGQTQYGTAGKSTRDYRSPVYRFTPTSALTPYFKITYRRCGSHP